MLYRPGFLSWSWPRFLQEVYSGADLRGPYILQYLADRAAEFLRLQKSGRRLAELSAGELRALFGESHLFAPALDEIPLTGRVADAHFLKFCERVGSLQASAFPATELLARRRPDYFIGVFPELCRDFGIKADELSLKRYWSEMIGSIVRSPWWRARPPMDTQDLSIWRRRSAMLQALYIDD